MDNNPDSCPVLTLAKIRTGLKAVYDDPYAPTVLSDLTQIMELLSKVLQWFLTLQLHNMPRVLPKPEQQPQAVDSDSSVRYHYRCTASPYPAGGTSPLRW
jgi:hypothetical protein